MLPIGIVLYIHGMFLGGQSLSNTAKTSLITCYVCLMHMEVKYRIHLYMYIVCTQVPKDLLIKYSRSIIE